jgi:hypothetical protein
MVSFAFLAITALKLFDVYLPKILSIRPIRRKENRKPHLKTQFPTSSAFHALTNATSPAILGSRTYRLPFSSRASFLIPGILTPFEIPPSW